MKCPDCKGKLKIEMYDMEFDNLVYQCKNCGKEWI